MLELFRRISLPHFAEHKLRTILTVIGMALGAATAVGLDMTFQPIHDSLRHSAERLAGRAVLKVSNGEAGVPEELLDEVRRVPGVSVAAASIVGSVEIADRKGEELSVFGIDLLEDQKIRDYRLSEVDEQHDSENRLEDPLLFLAKADSVALSGEFLRSVSLKIGDRVEVDTPSGKRGLTIRGSLDTSHGPASLFAGRIALMDIFAAQKLLRLDRRFSQIDISLKPGASLDAVQRAVAAVSAGRGAVEQENRGMESVLQLIVIAEGTIRGANLVVGLLGMYIVFNTMTIAVAQRRREIGILRAAGARRLEILELVLVESLAFAVLGATLGAPLGIGLARFFSSYFLPLLGSTYVPAELPHLELRFTPVLAAFVGGLVTAPLAALIPAFQAAGVHPLKALSRAVVRTDRVESFGRLAAVGLTILIAGQVPLVIPRQLEKWTGDLLIAALVEFGASYCSYFIGVALIAPFLIRAGVLYLEPVVTRTSRALGPLASRSIANNMRRIALTGTAFVLSVMMSTFIATGWSTLSGEGARISNRLLGGFDVLASGSASFDVDTQKPVPANVADEIAQVPGVASANSMRLARFSIGHQPLMLFALDASWEHPGFMLKSGDTRQVAEALAKGQGVVIDESGAHFLGLRLNDQIALDSPNGKLRLPILGVAFASLLNPSAGSEEERGQLYIDRKRYREFWRDDTVTLIGAALRAGANEAEVIDAIRSRLAGRHRIFVFSAGSFRRELQARMTKSMAPFIPIFTFALVIAILGLVNSLFASVLDRSREIGGLRATGATTVQIGRMILLEATTLGVVGAVLSIPIGISMSYLNSSQNEHFFGISISCTPPPLPLLIAIFVVTSGMAAAAGYFPGRAAGQANIVEAIKSE